MESPMAHLIEALPILFKRQGEVLASQFQRQLFYDLGGSIPGISLQIFSTWEDDQALK